VAILRIAAEILYGFYGRFREAGQSAPEFGTAQISDGSGPRGRRARGGARSWEEGADMIMVKPAAALSRIIQRFASGLNVTWRPTM